MKLTPIAVCRTTTSPLPGGGVSRSVHTSASGPPGLKTINPLLIVPLLIVLSSAFDVEDRIDRNLQSRRESVGLRGKADDSDQVRMLRIAHAFGPCRRRMRMNAIGAAVGGGDRDINHFADQRI